MRFLSSNKMELSDTAVPDIFIHEYMNQLDFNSLKLYLFVLNINKSKKEITLDNIAKMICVSREELNKSFNILEEKGLFVKTEKEYIIKDLKEIEIEKIYDPKLEKCKKSKKKNDPARKMLFNAINTTFFAGNMATAWYIDITKFIDEYNFDNDVILGLFTTCQNNNKLFNKYVETVAENWNKAGIKTEDDLNEYIEKENKVFIAENKIKKFFRRSNNLTTVEMKYVDSWVNDYQFEYSVIEKALCRSSSKANPLQYANKVLQNWNEKGIKTEKDIEELKNKTEEVICNTSQVKQQVKTTSNFEKRTYNNLNNLFDNL